MTGEVILVCRSSLSRQEVLLVSWKLWPHKAFCPCLNTDIAALSQSSNVPFMSLPWKNDRRVGKVGCQVLELCNVMEGWDKANGEKHFPARERSQVLHHVIKPSNRIRWKRTLSKDILPRNTEENVLITTILKQGELMANSKSEIKSCCSKDLVRSLYGSRTPGLPNSKLS